MALGMQSMVSLAFEQPMEVIVQYQMMGNTMQRGEWTWESGQHQQHQHILQIGKLPMYVFFVYIVCRKPFIFSSLKV